MKLKIKKDKYQVYVLSSPIALPVSFVVHTWFVAISKGKIERWDIFDGTVKSKNSWGHLHLNALKPEQGIVIIPLYNRFHWKNIKILNYIEGGSNSLAHMVCKFLSKLPKEYPYNYFYKFVQGPNSNTFSQWVLNKFPEWKVKLPANAFGKNYLPK